MVSGTKRQFDAGEAPLAAVMLQEAFGALALLLCGASAVFVARRRTIGVRTLLCLAVSVVGALAWAFTYTLEYGS